MRAIKFRAFNKTENKFHDFVEVRIVPKIKTNILDFTIPDDEDIIVQQYTGLKDSKGVEIYESDIIKAKIGAVDFILKIEFENGKFMAVGDDDLTAFDLFTITDKCEVIGNIFENPELLEK